MGLPPWAASTSQLFVLITGANSGLGFCVCQRLIAEFLSAPSRDPQSHLVLTITTRSTTKTRNTIIRLRKHLTKLAEEWAQKEQAKGRQGDWKNAVNRVHLLGTECDLCDIRGAYDTADRIKNGYVVSGEDGSLKARIPRLDVLIMNAGISGYLGFNYPRAIPDLLLNLKQSVTWPDFIRTNVGVVAKPQNLLKPVNGHTVKTGEDSQQLLNGVNADDEPQLGEVFLANVFGHYLLAHNLMPLLSNTTGRPTGDKARIIWLSSLDALQEKFSLDDIQGLKSSDAYKSSKRLTDVLALTSDLPAVRKASASWFACGPSITNAESTQENTPRKSKRLASAAANGNANGDTNINGSAGSGEEHHRPEMYVAHPGICVTDIVALWLWQRLCYILVLYAARWLGSIWHAVEPYKGACAITWVALAEQSVLDNLEGTGGDIVNDGVNGGDGGKKEYGSKKGKWGTCTDWWGEERVRRTEVEGWGWDGHIRPEIEGEEKKGRKHGAKAVTQEEREEFELKGVRAWTMMEELRREWEERLGLGEGARR